MREEKEKKKIIVVFYAEDTDKNAERENYDIPKQAFRSWRIKVAMKQVHNKDRGCAKFEPLIPLRESYAWLRLAGA